MAKNFSCNLLIAITTCTCEQLHNDIQFMIISKWNQIELEIVT